MQLATEEVPALFYSKSTGGFYAPEIHGDKMPGDVVDVPDEQYQLLMAGQAKGGRIVGGPDGTPMLMPLTPTVEDVAASIAADVQLHLDSAAREAGYDDIRSAVSYADEPAVPAFQADGRAFREWRSLVWARCFALLGEVKAGSRPPMVARDVIAELPPLKMPVRP